MHKNLDFTENASVIVPQMPIVYEKAVYDFASKWENAKDNDKDAVFLTIGDIRDTLAGNVPFTTGADPIEDIREILRQYGIEESVTQHSGVVYILRQRGKTQEECSNENIISLF